MYFQDSSFYLMRQPSIIITATLGLAFAGTAAAQSPFLGAQGQQQLGQLIAPRHFELDAEITLGDFTHSGYERLDRACDPFAHEKAGRRGG